MPYYEVDCKIERKEEETCTPFNKVTLDFNPMPHYYEVVRRLAERYPRFNLIGITRTWEASSKAAFMEELYSKPFSGD